MFSAIDSFAGRTTLKRQRPCSLEARSCTTGMLSNLPFRFTGIFFSRPAFKASTEACALFLSSDVHEEKIWHGLLRLADFKGKP